MKRDFNNPAPNRLVQMRRLLQVAAIVAASRASYLSVDNVAAKLREQTGETWHGRTVRRDLKALDTLGIVEKSDRTGRFKWAGKTESLSRVVLQSAEIDTSIGHSSPILQAMLAKLPAPWEMDAERHRIATSAARLAAMADTGERRFLKSQLMFVLGTGWELQEIASPSSFDQFKSLTQLASAEFDETTRWETTELVPQSLTSMDTGAVK